MGIARLVTATAVSAMVVVGSASAASMDQAKTDGLFANVAANVAFLSQSSRSAIRRAEAPAMRDFARNEADDTTATIATLTNVGHFAMADTNGADVAGRLITGRSVAVAGSADVHSVRSVPAANGRASLGDRDLAQLESASGPAFDDLYWRAQLDALSQIESDYRTYIAHGDDAALVAFSKRELAKTMQQLQNLTRI